MEKIRGNGLPLQATIKQFSPCIDYDANEKDFPGGDLDLDDEWSDDGIFNHDVAVPDIIFNNHNDKAVRVFKIPAKIDDFPSLLVGETRFIFGLSSLPVESVNNGFPVKFHWDVAEMQLVENDTFFLAKRLPRETGDYLAQ